MGGGMKFILEKDGTLAEYFHVNAATANLALIPDGIPDKAAIFVSEAMPLGFGGAERANIPLGGTVAIFGQGPVGLMATAAARLRGAGLVIAVETDPKRADIARALGADEVIDFKMEDPVERILRLTGGDGVDSSIEAVGNQVTFANSIKVTRPGGTVSVLGWFIEGEYVMIPRLEWGLGIGDMKIVSTAAPGGRDVMKRMLRLIAAGRLDPTLLGTHRFRFDEAEKAVQLVRLNDDGVIKALVEFV
jgi:threonine dehydrogenase-like Zn-dependent dehydrogenase